MKKLGARFIFFSISLILLLSNYQIVNALDAKSNFKQSDKTINNKIYLAFGEDEKENKYLISEEDEDPIKEDKNSKEIIDDEANKLYDYIAKEKENYELLKDMNIREYIDDFMEDGKAKLDYNMMIKALLSYGARETISALKIVVILFVIGILGAMITNMQSSFENETINNIVNFAFKGMAFLILLQCVNLGMDECKIAIDSMNDFMYALIPVMSILIASVGGASSAAIMNPLIISVVTIGTNIVKDFFIPLIFMGFILKYINNLTSGKTLNKLASFLDKTVEVTQKYLLMVGVFIITVRSIVSSSFDELTMKSAKFAVDNFVPVVGGALSDALSTVIGYSYQLKGAIGTLGLIFIVVIVVLPIIKVTIIASALKLAGAFIEPFSISDFNISDLLTDTGETITKLCACLITVAVLFFIIITILIVSGKVV